MPPRARSRRMQRRSSFETPEISEADPVAEAEALLDGSNSLQRMESDLMFRTMMDEAESTTADQGGLSLTRTPSVVVAEKASFLIGQLVERTQAREVLDQVDNCQELAIQKLIAKISGAEPSEDSVSIPGMETIKIGELASTTGCPHLATIAPRTKLSSLDECSECDKPLFNWACLCCATVFCGNVMSTIRHQLETGHCLTVSAVTMKPRCSVCNSAFEFDCEKLALQPMMEEVHLSKYGNLDNMRDVSADMAETVHKIKQTQERRFQISKNGFNKVIKDNLAQFAASIGQGENAQNNPLNTERQQAVLNGGGLEAICAGVKSGKYKRVVVLAGAGISDSAGIPDFRSPGTGLYHTLAGYNLPTPESIFDIEYFKDNPKPFYHLAKEIYPRGDFRPGTCHGLLLLLQQHKLLHRVYTQNIDCLERLAGLVPHRVVEAHGSFATASCTACHKAETDRMSLRRCLETGEVPLCSSCSGVVKPDITFFGESLPNRFRKLYKQDMEQCDLLIVMGTSLQVAPVSGLAGQVPWATPRILINPEIAGNFEADSYRDVLLLGDCHQGAEQLASGLGWASQLEEAIRKFQKSEMSESHIERMLETNCSCDECCMGRCTHKVFVYGTLMSGMHNHHVLSDSQFVADAVTESDEFTMVTRVFPFDPSRVHYGFPFVLDGENSADWCSHTCIRGEVYDVDDEVLSKLDQLERHPMWHRRQIVHVRTDALSTQGQTICEALMYVLNCDEDINEVKQNHCLGVRVDPPSLTAPSGQHTAYEPELTMVSSKQNEDSRYCEVSSLGDWKQFIEKVPSALRDTIMTNE